MRNLGMIDTLKPIDAETLKKKLGKHTRFSFLFTATFDDIIEMGYDARQYTAGICGANEKADEILNQYVPDLSGSMSDMSYNIVGYKQRMGMGIVTIQVTSAVKELDLP